MMKRLLSVAVLIAAVALPAGVVPGCKSKRQAEKAWVVPTYLIVDVRASKEWLSAHDVRVVLDDGNEYPLPVVFRVAEGHRWVGMKKDEDSGALKVLAGRRTGKLVCFPEANLGLAHAIFDIDALGEDDISQIVYCASAPADAVLQINRPSDEYIDDLLSRAVMIDVPP